MKKELVVLHDCSGIINFSNNQASAFLSCFVSDCWYQPPTCLKNMDMSQVKIKFRLKSFKPRLILNFLCVSLRAMRKEIYNAYEILLQMSAFYANVFSTIKDTLALIQMYVLVLCPLEVNLSFSHTHIGLPQGFNFSFQTSIPVTFV